MNQQEIDQLKARVTDLEAEIRRTDELLLPLCGQTRWNEFPPSAAPKLFEDSDGHFVRCAVNRVIEHGYFRSEYMGGYDRSSLMNPLLKSAQSES